MANPSELSPDFILQLKAELEADIRLFDELPTRIALKKKRYEAALLFAPADFDPNMSSPSRENTIESVAPPSKQQPAEFNLIPPEQEVTRSRVYWHEAIMSVLESSQKGLPHKEVLTMVKSAFPQIPSSNGEKGFYNAVAKLDAHNRIVKHGGLLYSAKLIKEMTERGEALPEAEFRRRAGGSSDIVLSILREHKEGLTGAQLKEIASDFPDAPRSLRDHGQYIYNILATLIGTGAIVKVNGIYKLSQEPE
ncbi:hypothetical protein [Herbaspirillum huttiense]|uniref:hypothetical protein n=1 Tax=Herbaspirillum huttiense TaxID=863372 RepID=UPI0031D52F3F